MYFVNTGCNTWNAYEYVDGTQVNATPVALTYSSSGLLSAVVDTAGGTDTSAIDFGTYTPTTTGAAPMNVAFDLSKTTQYGDTFGVTSITQDGFTTGKLSGISVDSSGVVQANYTNGRVELARPGGAGEFRRPAGPAAGRQHQLGGDLCFRRGRCTARPAAPASA